MRNEEYQHIKNMEVTPALLLAYLDEPGPPRCRLLQANNSEQVPITEKNVS